MSVENGVRVDWDASCMTITSADGEPLAVSSILWRSGLIELRVPHPDFPTTGAPFLHRLGRGPIRITLAHPVMNSIYSYLLHFEKAWQVCPCECAGSGAPVNEVVLLSDPTWVQDGKYDPEQLPATHSARRTPMGRGDDQCPVT